MPTGGILPIDIDPIQPQILHQGDRTLGELGSALGRPDRSGKMIPIAPATNGQHHFHLSIALLEQEQLLDATVYVRPGVVPRIVGVMLVGVGPRVG